MAAAYHIFLSLIVFFHIVCARYYGRILEDDGRGEDIFLYHTSGIYAETAHLLLDLKPLDPPKVIQVSM